MKINKEILYKFYEALINHSKIKDVFLFHLCISEDWSRIVNANLNLNQLKIIKIEM